MKGQQIPVTQLGAISRTLLAYARQGVVFGTTSQGIFIKLNTHWILFLSIERVHGPLTVNLSGGKSTLKGVEVRQRIVIHNEKIQISSNGTEIDFSRAETWEPPPLPGTLLPASQRLDSLRTTARYILSQHREPNLYLVLKDILEVDLEGLPLPPTPFIGEDFNRLLQLLKTANLEEIVLALTPLLGSGTGLTPAGDDLILGLLLAYSRWGRVLWPAFDLAELTDLINAAANQKTTLLSLNLLACASQGQANERLISALDGIMTGNYTPEQCASYLSSWGSSSGCDSLVGMALAILSASG